MYAKKVAIAMALFVSCWLTPRPASAGSQEIIEAAKQEGEVIWYGGGNNVIDEKINEGFRKKYPFLQPKKYRLTSYKLLSRFRAESHAGKHIADIVRTTDAILYTFKKEGLLMQYSSPEREHYIDQLKDRDGYYTAFYKFHHVIAYNTNLVPKQETPHSYRDLLNPRWKGQMGLPDASAGYVWFGNQLKIMGKEQGLKFMKELGRQDVKLLASGTQLVKLVGAGEYAIAINSYAYNVERLKEKEAPIDWVPVEPVVANNLFGGISKNAPHPNAAKLFMDFLLSEEGQKIYLEAGLQPARNGLHAPWLPKDLKLFYSDPKEMAERYNDFQEQFREIFGGTSS